MQPAYGVMVGHVFVAVDDLPAALRGVLGGIPQLEVEFRGFLQILLQSVDIGGNRLELREQFFIACLDLCLECGILEQACIPDGLSVDESRFRVGRSLVGENAPCL